LKFKFRVEHLAGGLLAVFMSMASLAASPTPEAPACDGCHFPDEIGDAMGGLHGSVHWQEDTADTPANGDGCASCHGTSRNHANAPTTMQPDISFGPRWTNSVSEQNEACLSCHGEEQRQDWIAGEHADEDLTCGNCHDSHLAEDPILGSANGQNQVCGVCHKIQKDGIHDLPEHLPDNPPCSSCHEPHGDPHPSPIMLSNRSEGCRACHDLEQMMASPTAPPRANSYHKVMASPERTCVDCHRSVAHVDAANFAAILAGGFESHPVNLFFPDQTDSEALLTEHPGGQALRQGRNCRQCHIGEAAELGELLAGPGVTPWLPVTVGFQRAGDRMELSVSFEGTADSVAVMFDDGHVEDFTRGGCWAACHSDMPGMTRDRGQGLNKYLRASRAQARSIGRPAINHNPETLERMRGAGLYVELWQISLGTSNDGTTQVQTILEAPRPDETPNVTSTVQRSEGTTTVTFSRAIDDALKPLIPGRAYTFGVAVHGGGSTGAEHWVSLPLTVSLDGFDTDFVVAE
jgi:DmsE family decaheme c-type cytochrome